MNSTAAMLAHDREVPGVVPEVGVGRQDLMTPGPVGRLGLGLVVDRALEREHDPDERVQSL